VSGYEPWARLWTVVRLVDALAAAVKGLEEDMEDPRSVVEGRELLALALALRAATDRAADTAGTVKGLEEAP